MNFSAGASNRVLIEMPRKMNCPVEWDLSGENVWIATQDYETLVYTFCAVLVNTHTDTQTAFDRLHGKLGLLS